MNVEAANVLPVRDFVNAPAPARHVLNLSHVKLSPYAYEVEQATIAWLQNSGLLPEKRYLEKIDGMAVWGYVGFSHPFGGVEETTLYAKFLTLWLLWDDLVVEKASDLGAVSRGIAQAFQWDKGTVNERDPYLRAWRSIVDGYKNAGVSRDFLRRLARKMDVWVQATARENNDIRAASPLSARGHFRRRLITIGVLPAVHLLDLDVGDIDRQPAARRVLTATAANVTLANELASVEKDADRVNIVPLLQSWHHCDFESAYGRAVDLCRLSLEELSAAIEALPARLQTWGQSVLYMAEGFNYWHFACAPRYNGNRIQCQVAQDVLEHRWA